MMSRYIVWNIVLSVAAAGCGAAAEDPETVGVADLELVGENALSPNALNPNALSPNALSPDALAAITSPDHAGALSRQLLRYTIGCAFSPTQSFSHTWTDSAGTLHSETYPGLLGIAPMWATGPLNLDKQQLISACLAGRTNWYEASVVISMRSQNSPLKTQATPQEVAAYPSVEGGFWGNLFAASPYLRSCYNDSTVDHSRSSLRECAAGHLNTDQTISTCGMISIIGSCNTHCSTLHAAGQFYPDCTDPVHGKTSNMVTIALP